MHVCLLGGVDSLSAAEGACAEGFAMVAMARPLIREPNFIQRMEAAALAPGPTHDVTSKCIRCNLCVIASVDPAAAEAGCPFLRLERRRKAAAQTKAAVLANDTAAAGVVVATECSGRVLGDIEDIARVELALPAHL